MSAKIIYFLCVSTAYVKDVLSKYVEYVYTVCRYFVIGSVYCCVYSLLYRYYTATGCQLSCSCSYVHVYNIIYIICVTHI